MDFNDILLLLGVLVAWYILTTKVLPRFGGGT